MDSKAVEQVLVVSRDSSALALARDMGASTVQEDGAPSLNTALKRATKVAQVYGSSGVLVIPADLPLLTGEAISVLLQRATGPPVVVIAPDRHRRGTNALLLAPTNLIEYGFGANSFARHCERALLAGARLEVVELTSLGLDLDLPEDLDLVQQLKGPAS
jgi:2-phospho-L-lactate guanylyltransferase